MNNDQPFNLTKYMSNGIELIVKDAIKATIKNPKGSAFWFKFAASAKRAAKTREIAESRGEHIPPFLIASITGQCNLHCTGCYAHANASCEQEEMDAQAWGRIISEAKELGVSVIMLAGGEPFMRPDVIAAAAAEPKVLFPIFTNGTVLGESDYRMLDQYRNLVPIISIEGDEIHTDNRRGSGVYEQTENTMQKLYAQGILFGASITITTENLTVVTEKTFVDDLYRKGCRIVFYVEYVPFEAKSLALTDAERLIFDNRLAQLRQTEMFFISFPGDEKDMGGCLAAGRGFFHIATNGDVEPCPFSPYSDMNLRDYSLREALESPLFRKLRTEEVLNKPHTGGCVLFENEDIVEDLLAHQ